MTGRWRPSTLTRALLRRLLPRHRRPTRCRPTRCRPTRGRLRRRRPRAPPDAAGEGADGAAGADDAAAADAPDASDPIDTAQIADLERLLQTLEDDAERQVFVERLRGLLEASQQFDQASGPDVVVDLPLTLLERLRRWAQSLEDVTVDVPAIGTWAVEQVANAFNRRYWTGVGLALLTILGPALVAYVVIRTIQKRLSRPLLKQALPGQAPAEHCGWRRSRWSRHCPSVLSTPSVSLGSPFSSSRAGAECQ